MTAAEESINVAEMLYRAGCIAFSLDEPFVFTSQRKSPVYVDVRRIISFPRVRAAMMNLAISKLRATCGVDFDVIAGGETAGIPFAAWIAADLILPMIYVRKQAKGIGTKKQIEGILMPGQTVLLVEDLASEGTSKLNFIQAIRQGGGIVEHCFVIFDYGIFSSIRDTMTSTGVQLHSLVDFYAVLDVAKNDLSPEQIQKILLFVEDPDNWNS